MSGKTLRPLTVAGMMSGTSADGIDIAIVRIAPRGRGGAVSLELLTHRGFPFAKPLRQAVLAAQDAQRTTTAELARLHWRLGIAYAGALRTLRSQWSEPIDLVGCHGQTIYHQGVAARYAGERFACTWQIGEMAPLAAEAGVPVISNFRPADMVAGGQGAPLVPLLDEMLYRDRSRTRVLQNIGGIGNLTMVPAAGSGQATLAFDTGPGNMVIDALMQQLYGKAFDRAGRVAASGRVLRPVVEQVLREPFFRQAPPRSAGREQFGAAFAARLLQQCRKLEKTAATRDAAAIATATALTAHSIALAVERFVAPAMPSQGGGGLDLIVSGGGARNAALMSMLDSLLAPRSIRLLATSDPALPAPMPVEAKEAAAFALLAYMSWHRRPGNVPTATGARQAAVLGQVTCA